MVTFILSTVVEKRLLCTLTKTTTEPIFYTFQRIS